MASTSLLAFWAVSLLLIVVPGADWAFTLDAGLRGAVLPGVGGLVLGYLLLTAITATGVGVLVASSTMTLGTLTVVGGAYLIWHGLTTVRRPSPAPGGSLTVPPEAGRWAGSSLARGVGVSGLNPKGLLVFLSLLPQFVDPAASWPVAAQIGALGLLFVASDEARYVIGVTSPSMPAWPLSDRSITGPAGEPEGAGFSPLGAVATGRHMRNFPSQAVIRESARGTTEIRSPGGRTLIKDRRKLLGTPSCRRSSAPSDRTWPRSPRATSRSSSLVGDATPPGRAGQPVLRGRDGRCGSAVDRRALRRVSRPRAGCLPLSRRSVTADARQRPSTRAPRPTRLCPSAERMAAPAEA